MADPVLLARLAQHRSLGPAPEGERIWLAEHSTLRTLAVGDVLTHKGENASGMHIYLSGHVVIRADRGAGAHKVFEWHGGDVGGLLPFSRGTKPPNDAVAEEPTEVLEVPSKLFPELIRECPTVTATMVHTMVDRARQFTSSDHRDEKLISLGKLAAGLAHELNNPASAAVRNAKALIEALSDAEVAARRLYAARLSDAQLSAIDTVRETCLHSAIPVIYSAVARADREDALAAWLAAHGANEGCAVPLAETGISIAALDSLAASVGGEALDAALRWISIGCLVRTLSYEIETSTSRIHELVNAVKGFTFMDRAHAGTDGHSPRHHRYGHHARRQNPREVGRGLGADRRRTPERACRGRRA